MDLVNHSRFESAAIPLEGPGDNPVLTVIVKGTFNIRPGIPAEISEKQMPVLYGAELNDPEKPASIKFETDIVPFKPRADIVLVGKAYAPEGRAAQSFEAALKVGNMGKSILVFGDRNWVYTKKFLSSSITISFARPVTEMEIVYENAFGGADKISGGVCGENPAGKGFLNNKSDKTIKTIDGIPLPNIEDPRNMIRNYNDHPMPAGFGFYGMMWEPRRKYLGTYDEKWQKERAPKRPGDFSFDFYNSAHPDLQVKGYLRGDEDVVLLNLSPDGEVRFKLPGINPVAKVSKSVTFDGPTTEELVQMDLDTLCLIPDENRFYLVWRGTCHIKDLTASEIRKVEIGI
ncbi:MAG: DUF2169 domain-containing protein [Nitrospirae bacterium]|nr:DUF2169 domain-containing protein [Nitrospirota bacterium]